ncbi:hypothetical protein HYV49_05580 [Candidatus Pacearchaeota archaeon]|nr:hypothetical protein [Candidatus Pacearchaeota archaeon]
MNFAVVYSSHDIAGNNIADQLRKLDSKINIYEFKEKEHIIFLNNLDKNIKEDFIIFASKHKAKEHNKTLTVHSIGNFGKAEVGGIPGEICKSSAFVNKLLFQELIKEVKGSSYICTLEATHHGPYIEKPSCFIELGSSEEEWNDELGGNIIARTIINFIKPFKNLKDNFIPAVGIGGPHYCPSFNKIQLNSKYAISHVLPQYHMPFTEQMIKELISKTIEKPEVVILDWKGIGKAEDRKHLLDILDKLNLKYIRTNEVE